MCVPSFPCIYGGGGQSTNESHLLAILSQVFATPQKLRSAVASPAIWDELLAYLLSELPKFLAPVLARKKGSKLLVAGHQGIPQEAVLSWNRHTREHTVRWKDCAEFEGVGFLGEADCLLWSLAQHVGKGLQQKQQHDGSIVIMSADTDVLVMGLVPQTLPECQFFVGSKWADDHRHHSVVSINILREGLGWEGSEIVSWHVASGCDFCSSISGLPKAAFCKHYPTIMNFLASKHERPVTLSSYTDAGLQLDLGVAFDFLICLNVLVHRKALEVSKKSFCSCFHLWLPLWDVYSPAALLVRQGKSAAVRLPDLEFLGSFMDTLASYPSEGFHVCWKEALEVGCVLLLESPCVAILSGWRCSLALKWSSLLLLQEDQRGWESAFSDSPSKPFCKAHFLTVVRDLVHMERARTTQSAKLSKITIAPMSSLAFHLLRSAWVLEYWSAAFDSHLHIPDIQERGWESDGCPCVMSEGDSRIWFDMWQSCGCSEGAGSCASASCACARSSKVACSVLCR